MHQVTMPRLSDSMSEGTILRWLKATGDEVRRGEEIVEIETDKATMPYEAEVAGVLTIVAGEGATVAVGTPIATIGAAVAPDASGSTSRNGGGAHAVLSPSAVVSPAAPAVAQVSAPAAVDAAVAGPLVAQAVSARLIKAAPVARRAAQRLGVDLATIAGTGPYGRVLKADVVAAAAAGAVVQAQPAVEAQPAVQTQPAVELRPTVAIPATASQAPLSASDTTVVELTRTQATIARRMAESRASVPDFALEVDVDMAAATAWRAELKQVANPAPSLNDLIIKACAIALRRHPRANGSYRDGHFELQGEVNVGLAVAATDALIVPVVRQADTKSLGAIAAETRQLAERVRSGAVTPAELSGGTFTVSNLGMYGIDRFEGIINAPQAAILCVGAVTDRPVARDGKVVIAPQMTVTLACDHRILYGAEAAAFLAEIRSLLEQPLALVL